MFETTPFTLFKTKTISALLQTEATEPLRIIRSGHSLGTFKLGYLIYQVNQTRSVVIPTYKRDVCFYDQHQITPATGEIDIDAILQRAEQEHIRLVKEGRLPARPDPARRKEMRFPVGEINEITNEHQTHRYTFYEAVIPLAGSNTESPYKIVAWGKWHTNPEPNQDPLIQYGIGLPKDEIAITAYLCCRDEPREHDKTLVVYRDGSAQLIIAAKNVLEFPKGTFTISRSQHYRFKYPKDEPTTQ